MFYQYQLSKASLITLQENGGMNARVGANSRSNSGVILNDNSNAIDTNEVLNKIKKIKVIDNLLNQEGKILLTNKLDTSTSTTVKRTSTNSVHNVSAKLSKIVSTQSDDEGKNVNRINSNYIFFVVICSNLAIVFVCAHTYTKIRWSFNAQPSMYASCAWIFHGILNSQSN